MAKKITIQLLTISGFIYSYFIDYSGIQYLMNATSLRGCLYEIEKNEPESYKKIFPKFQVIEKKEKNAKAILITSVITGAVMFVGGLTMGSINSLDLPIGATMGTMLSGITVAATGAFIFLGAKPKLDDYRKFINHSNKYLQNDQLLLSLNRKNPLEMINFHPEVYICIKY
ncbi:MAG: hypothetical protein A2096_03895 [Spirochaetes bacterium GWF1_41_5]|nr:MAG: hypothetical protein A2096_03895 [Spirochaetes bacterium GWF1_41_5]